MGGGRARNVEKTIGPNLVDAEGGERRKKIERNYLDPIFAYLLREKWGSIKENQLARNRRAPRVYNKCRYGRLHISRDITITGIRREKWKKVEKMAQKDW